ncbi:MAG: hypothetical protein Q9215_006036, partial [Flavoplaca cf. flavocitrina]
GSDIWGVHLHFRVSDAAVSFAEGIAFDEVGEERADSAAGGTPGGGPEGYEGCFVGGGKLEEGGEFGLGADAVVICVD